MGKNIDYTGRRFGSLVVVVLHGRAKRGRKVWECLCDCGKTTLVQTDALTQGTRSCGCAIGISTKLRATTHGATANRGTGPLAKTYRIWGGMKARCYTTSATGFHNYGGRGITVCMKWHTFEGFLEDMGAAPEWASLDRIDNDAEYCKDNCHWATTTAQSRNTSRTRFVMCDGALRVARDVALERGISEGSFKTRLYARKWSIEEACGLVPRRHGNTYGEAK